jgi:hypothetical protein
MKIRACPAPPIGTSLPTQRFGNLCVTPGTDVKLGTNLGTDPIELLRMINGRESRPEQLSVVWRRKSTAIRATSKSSPTKSE